MVERSSHASPEHATPQQAAEPHLFLAFDGNHPQLPTSRHRLGGIGEIVIGRGRKREVVRERHGDIERLILRFPDPWMSTEHVRILRTERGLVMNDPGSKNGSLVNGVRQVSAVLTDGDLLQFGHTFFVYRDALPVARGEPPDVTADLDAPPGLQTMLSPLAQLFEAFAHAAVNDVPLLIVGERGTGKNVLAQTAHALSGRTEPFVILHPAKMDALRLERRLRGARDEHGALSVGALAGATGGTLVIDGLESVPITVQPTLAEALREGRLALAGSSEVMPVSCRLIATASSGVSALARKRALDPALEECLSSAFSLHLPPLRQRREDLGLLVASMLAHYAPRNESTFTAEAAHALFCYSWPSNMRELEGCVGTALALSGGGIIDFQHLPIELQRPFNPVQETGSDTLDTIELTEQDLKKRAEIIAALRARSGDLLASTDSLIKARSQFQSWLARHKIQGDQSDT